MDQPPADTALTELSWRIAHPIRCWDVHLTDLLNLRILRVLRLHTGWGVLESLEAAALPELTLLQLAADYGPFIELHAAAPQLRCLQLEAEASIMLPDLRLHSCLKRLCLCAPRIHGPDSQENHEPVLASPCVSIEVLTCTNQPILRQMLQSAQAPALYIVSYDSNYNDDTFWQDARHHLAAHGNPASSQQSVIADQALRPAGIDLPSVVWVPRQEVHRQASLSWPLMSALSDWDMEYADD